MNHDPQYRDCLIISKQIMTKSIPELSENYESFSRSAKDYIMGRESLHTSRTYTQAAIRAKRQGKVDNKHVANYLDILTKKDKKMNYRSDELDTLLKAIRDRFIKEKRIISELNLQHINTIKRGTTPADEMTVMLVELGNQINKLSYEKLQEFREEIESMIKKIERDIVEDTLSAYQGIMKLDKKTFDKMDRKEWTNTDFQGFFRAGAYEFSQEYLSGTKK